MFSFPLQALRQENAQLKNDLSRLKPAASAAVQQLKKCKEDNRELRTALRLLTEEKNELNKQLLGTRTQYHEIDMWKQRHGDLEKASAAKDERIATLQRQLDDLTRKGSKRRVAARVERSDRSDCGSTSLARGNGPEIETLLESLEQGSTSSGGEEASLAGMAEQIDRRALDHISNNTTASKEDDPLDDLLNQLESEWKTEASS